MNRSCRYGAVKEASDPRDHEILPCRCLATSTHYFKSTGRLELHASHRANPAIFNPRDPLMSTGLHVSQQHERRWVSLVRLRRSKKREGVKLGRPVSEDEAVAERVVRQYRGPSIDVSRDCMR